MAGIIDLDSRRPGWETWWTVCLACGKDNTISVVHMDTKGPLECPRCHEMKLVRTAPAT